jgi:hypothetical protein
MLTHARSGARFTTPSPVVTMTDGPGGGGCCAKDGVAVRREKHKPAASFFIAHQIFRLKAEAT